MEWDEDKDEQEVLDLVNRTVEMCFKSGDETDWDIELFKAWMQKQLYHDSPQLLSRIVALSPEDQQQYCDMVRHKVASRVNARLRAKWLEHMDTSRSRNASKP